MLVLPVSAELDASFLITASSVTLVYATRHGKLFNAAFTQWWGFGDRKGVWDSK
jgi:hypothetical protein